MDHAPCHGKNPTPQPSSNHNIVNSLFRHISKICTRSTGAVSNSKNRRMAHCLADLPTVLLQSLIFITWRGGAQTVGLDLTCKERLGHFGLQSARNAVLLVVQELVLSSSLPSKIRRHRLLQDREDLLLLDFSTQILGNYLNYYCYYK